MGRIDTEAKHYMADNARFADAFNYFVYDGKQIISSNALTELDTTEIVVAYGKNAKIPVQKFRDLLKSWMMKTDGRAVYALLGTELESEVNYAMPVKAALYDSMHYAKQVETARKSLREQKATLNHGEFLSGFRKEDRLIPVVTLVIFLKDTEWDGPTHLREMFEDAEAQLLSFVPDYRINLLAPNRIPKEDFDKFRTDVGLLLEYIKNQKDKEKLDEITHENDRFRSVDSETASLINTITGSRLKFDTREEKVDMCKAIDDMRKESKEEGLTEGRMEGRLEGRLEGRMEGIESNRLESIRNVMDGLKYTAQQAMELLRIPAAEQPKYLAKL
jgi:hypothetical protein